jgi:MYXO-CTERM domain-containing protein
VHLSRLSRRSSLALLTAASLTALVLPAGAATTTAHPAKGVATSTLTVLRLTLAGDTVAAGQVVGVAGNTTSPHVAKLVITPIDSSLTGPVGQQTVSADATSTVPATPKSVTLPAGLGKVVGPTFSARAVDNATRVLTTLGLKALGNVQLVTVPLDLSAATLTDVATVTAGGARATKALSLGSLALPSLQDLLAALGVDLNALVQQLTQGNLTQLAGLVGGGLATLNNAVDTAQAALTTAGETPADSMAGALAELQTANTDASDADAAFTGALTTALAGVLGPALTTAGVSAATTATQFLAIPAATTAAPALAALAQAAVDAAAVVQQVNALVDALQALIDGVVAAVLAADDPLAALGDIKVTTSAIAARTPKAAADVQIGSVHVLGLANAIPLGTLTGALGTVTDTLSSVLESVAGVSFTAPKIAVGQPTKSTSRQGRTRFASASITGLSVTLPSISLSRSAAAAIAIPGVPTDISGKLSVGQLAETAQWTPATTASSTPDTSNGSPLPDTGGRMLLSVLGLLVIGAALALRRRSNSSA